MKVLLLLAFFVATVTSDVSHLLHNSGYQYPAPQGSDSDGYQYPIPSPSKPVSTSYGVPQASVLGNYGQNTNYNPVPPAISPTVPKVNDAGFQLPVVSNPAVPFQQQTPSALYTSPIVDTPQVISTASIPAGFASDANINSGTASLGTGYSNTQSFSQSVSSERFQHSNTATYTNSQTSNLAPEVTKNLYFFTGPEDEEIKTKVNFPPVAPKQNYKIIFIKTPSYIGQSSVHVPAPPPTEERTLVYVLVKKPEDQTDINVETAPTLPPTKPEVFFIKYNTQKEVENAIADIQNKHGANAQQITTGQGSFINGLGNTGTSFIDSGIAPSKLGGTSSSSSSSTAFETSGSTFGTKLEANQDGGVDGSGLYIPPANKYIPAAQVNAIL